MTTFKLLGSVLLAISLCFTACEEIKSTPEPTPDSTPDTEKSEIIIDNDFITNGLSFTCEVGEKSVSFTTNEDWTLSVASTSSGEKWCTASATSGTKGNATVKFSVTENTSYDDRSVSVTIKSGTASKIFTITQKYADALLLSKNIYEVGEEGGTIEIEVKTNVDYEVRMPDVDWIKEVSTRGMSSHSLQYIVEPNEEYDSRSAEITFYDKNSDLKETLKVEQAQKDAIIISEKSITVEQEGGIVEVKVNANIDFDVQIPSEVSWISIANTRSLTESSVYLAVDANQSEEDRNATIRFVNTDQQFEETVIITQKGLVVVTLKEAGTLRAVLGDDYLNITALKIIGPINGDDVDTFRRMLGFNQSGRLTTLDLYETHIVRGGEYMSKDIDNNAVVFHETYTDRFNEQTFVGCANLKAIKLPQTLTQIDFEAFRGCDSLETIEISENVTLISSSAFYDCTGLKNIDLPETLRTIGKYAFSGCSALSSITIPKNIDGISNGTFSGCSAITSIAVPDKVTIIGPYSFSGCSSLESITLGSGVKEIYQYAFDSSSIREFYCYAPTPPILRGDNYRPSYNVYRNTALEGLKEATLYVPKYSKYDYTHSSTQGQIIWSNHFKETKEIDE